MLVSISRSSFSFVHTSFMFMHMLLILYLEAMPSLWLSCESFVLMLSQRSNGWISEYSSDSQGLTSIMFFTAYVLYTYVDVDVQAATTTTMVMMQRAHCDTLASTAIEIPFSLYSTFVIEEEFGFNKQTIWVRARSITIDAPSSSSLTRTQSNRRSQVFFMDTIKVQAVTIAIACPVIICIIKIIAWGGESFWICTRSTALCVTASKLSL